LCGADVQHRCGLDGPRVQVDGGHALAAATLEALVVQTECTSVCWTSDLLKFNLMVLMDCEPSIHAPRVGAFATAPRTYKPPCEPASGY
jgi:hypothetical protein